MTTRDAWFIVVVFGSLPVTAILTCVAIAMG